jgi:serine/threonine protein kinase
MVEGIAHLHAQRIVHRDIKPHNILCAYMNENDNGGLPVGENPPIEDEDEGVQISTLGHIGNYRLKISDMGLSKQLDKSENSFSSMSYCSASLIQHSMSKGESRKTKTQHADMNSPVGTIGWQAPELMANRYTAIPSPTAAADSTIEESIAENSCLLREDTDSEEEADEEQESMANAEDQEITNLSAAKTDDDTDESNDITEKEQFEQLSMEEQIERFKRKNKIRLYQVAKVSKLQRRQTQAVDIFSLGCVLHYVLTLGEHPYGQWFEREANIMLGKVDLAHLASLPDARELISLMLQADPMRRPNGREICQHPFFWSSSKRLDFLIEFSDRVEQEDPKSQLVLALESNAAETIGQKWDKKLDSALLEDMGKYRKYDTNSVRDLLRVIRNKKHHFNELTIALKMVVGAKAEDFFNYFDSRFPNLLLQCVRVARKMLYKDHTFTAYFKRVNKADKVNPHEIFDRLQDVTASSKLVIEVNDEDASNSVVDTVLGTSQVVVWQNSQLEYSLQCKGWWREEEDWVDDKANAQPKKYYHNSAANRPAHLTRSSTDLKFRTRLCSHWESTGGAGCPMRKKGKCIFAHGPLELRVKENRRDRWALKLHQTDVGSPTSPVSLSVSGGEGVYCLKFDIIPASLIHFYSSNICHHSFLSSHV